MALQVSIYVCICLNIIYFSIQKYRLKKSTQLFDLAFRRSCGDPEDDANNYLHIVLKIVKFVGEMHKRNWILRDLCAENIYVTHDNEVSSGVNLFCSFGLYFQLSFYQHMYNVYLIYKNNVVTHFTSFKGYGILSRKVGRYQRGNQNP